MQRLCSCTQIDDIIAVQVQCIQSTSVMFTAPVAALALVVIIAGQFAVITAARRVSISITAAAFTAR